MELIGSKVHHKTFGDGLITSQDDRYISVQFADRVSKFEYLSKNSPFIQLMTVEDPIIQERILREVTRRKEEYSASLVQTMKKRSTDEYLAKWEAKQQKNKERREKQQKQRKHDEIYGLTPTSLALLGILDEFYDLYNSILELYESAGEELRYYSRDKVLSIQVRKLCEPVFNKYTPIFTSEFEKIWTPAYAFRSFSMYTYELHKGIRYIRFREFLSQVHWVITSIVVNKTKAKKGISLPYSAASKSICERIGELVQKNTNDRMVAEDSVIVSKDPLYLFESLSKTKCYRDNHPVSPMPFFAKLISESGVIDLPTHYCELCRKHFIGTKTLGVYEKKYGKMYLEKKPANTGDSYDGFGLESRLHQLGYNVVDGELTDQQRQDILKHILANNKLTYFEICSSIEQNLQLFKSSPRHRLAILKWEKDLKFLGDYIVEQGEKEA